MTRRTLFLPHQFHSGGGIIGNKVVMKPPAKVAFQTNQRAVHRSRLLSSNGLEICAITGECWGGNRLRFKIAPFLAIGSLLGLAFFVPGYELADITQIIPNGSEC